MHHQARGHARPADPRRRQGVRADAGRCRRVDRVDGLVRNLQRDADRRSGGGQHVVLVLCQSYRIYEQVACYTPAGDYALWFMYQPLLINKSTFEGLTPEQQAALQAGAAKAQAFYLEEAKLEDAASAEVFAEAGVEIAEMTEADFNAWRELAQETSYKAFVEEHAGRSGAAGPGAVGRVILRRAGDPRRAEGIGFGCDCTRPKRGPAPRTPRDISEPKKGTGSCLVKALWLSRAPGITRF